MAPSRSIRSRDARVRRERGRSSEARSMVLTRRDRAAISNPIPFSIDQSFSGLHRGSDSADLEAPPPFSSGDEGFLQAMGTRPWPVATCQTMIRLTEWRLDRVWSRSSFPKPLGNGSVPHGRPYEIVGSSAGKYQTVSSRTSSRLDSTRAKPTAPRLSWPAPGFQRTSRSRLRRSPGARRS
jgi:hypothetical protein